MTCPDHTATAEVGARSCSETQPTAERDGPEPGETIGRYRLEEKLGEGAMGVVVRAHDPDLDRTVALKLLRPGRRGSQPTREVRSRMIREGQALARLNHPNVVGVFDVGEHDGQAFIAMELVHGETLKRWRTSQDRSWREVVRVFLSAGQGLLAAHDVGLTHRDFKPANVMVSHDGRVQVMDFGLARSVDGAWSPSSGGVESGIGSSSEGDAESLTRTGTVMGTPGYMAPEQHVGKVATPAADQFSFCVAFYEALYGRRPFSGKGLHELHTAKSGGRYRSPPGNADGRALWPVLRRGLAPNPENRWPSMRHLLDALRRQQRSWLRRWGRWGAGGLAGIVGLAAAGSLSKPRCADPEDQLAGVWSPEQRDAAQGQFEASGVRFAPDAWHTVSKELDARRDGWLDVYSAACALEDEPVRDKTMACLSTRASQLHRFGDLMARADAAVVEAAPAAALGLDLASSCADGSEETHLPDDPEQALVVQRIYDALDEALTINDIGRADEALPIVQAAVDRARAVRFGPALALALHRRGYIEGDLGQWDAAQHSHEEAFWAATESGADRVAVEAASELVFELGARRHDTEGAYVWAKHARAAMQRYGPDPVLEANFLDHLGSAETVAGNVEKALALHRKALEIFEHELGPDHREVAICLNSLGGALGRSGRHDEAIEVFERTVVIWKGILGENNLFVAPAHHNIATTFREQGKFEESERYFRSALKRVEATRGPDHPDVARVLDGLSITLELLHRLDESIAVQRRSIAIFEATQGPDHPRLLQPLIGLSNRLLSDGQAVEARATLARARVICETKLGPDHPTMAQIVHNIGNTYQDAGDHTAAIEHYRQSVALIEKGRGPTEPRLRHPLTQMGRAQLVLGEIDEAVASLERAYAVRGDTTEPIEAAQTAFELGRAVAVQGDGARARVYATEALMTYEGLGVPARDDAEDVRGWLAEQDEARAR